MSFNKEYTIAQLTKAIAIMVRQRGHNSVCMVNWQSGIPSAQSVRKLHMCGNTACFAGHVAISKEFKQDGGILTACGAPTFCGFTGSGAIRLWLGISANEANNLVYGQPLDEPVHISPYYQKVWKEVDEEDVIAALRKLRKLYTIGKGENQ